MKPCLKLLNTYIAFSLLQYHRYWSAYVMYQKSSLKFALFFVIVVTFSERSIFAYVFNNEKFLAPHTRFQAF